MSHGTLVVPQQSSEMVNPSTEQTSSRMVFSGERTLVAPKLSLGPELAPDTRLEMDGLVFLAGLPADSMPAAFLDPQYRGVLENGCG